MPEQKDDESALDSEQVLAGALRAIDSLVCDGIIERFAIGGSIALLYFTEPFMTEDLDVFCIFQQSGTLLTLSPIYSHLKSLGYQADGEFVSVEGVLVQFLIPPTNLVQEALDKAIDVNIEGVVVKIFDYEYLLAILLETNRPKDRLKLELALNSREADKQKLLGILSRYNLIEKWNSATK